MFVRDCNMSSGSAGVIWTEQRIKAVAVNFGANIFFS